MAYAQILGILHLLLLIYIGRKIAASWVDGVARQFCAIGILTWGNIVSTCLILSVFRRINDVFWFEATSVFLAGLLWLVATHTSPDSAPERPKFPKMPAENIFHIVLSVSLALCAAISLYILFTHVPANWDTSAYRFPRAIWYYNSGSLLHFAKIPDPRTVFYPFNSVILYMFATAYQFGETGFELISFFAWCAGGVGVFTLATRLGASLTGSLFATFLALLTPTILSQAASTNDEIIASMAMMLTLPFVYDWFVTPRRRFALLGGLGLGLAIGAKLHWAFYYPYLILATVVGAFWLARHKELWQDQVRQRLIGLAIAIVPIALLGGSFLAFNWLSTGELTASAFNDQVMNKPFRLSLATEKLVAGTGQIMLSPIPDLLRSGTPEETAKYYDSFNRRADEMLFSGLSEVRKLTVEGFKFTGPLADGANSAAMMEYTVWVGFLPWLIAAVILLAAFRTNINRPALWLAASFFGWHLSYAAHTKYIAGVSAYYTYPALIACAGLGPVWDWCRTAGVRQRLLTVAFILTACTHLILAKNLFVYNNLRNVVYSWTKSPVTNMHRIDPTVAEAIRLSNKVHIPYTHWAQLFWHLMRENPTAAYTTGPPTIDTPVSELQLVGCPAITDRGRIAVALPRTATNSATFIGMAMGDRYYGTGAVATGLHPRQSGLAVVHLTTFPSPAGAWKSIKFEGPWIGVNSKEQFEFRASLVNSGSQKIFAGQWTSTNLPVASIDITAPDPVDLLFIEVRSVNEPSQITRSTIALNALSAPFPARVEYLSGDKPIAESDLPPLTSQAIEPLPPPGPIVSKFDLEGGRAIPVKIPVANTPGVGTSFDKRDYVIRWLRQSTVFEVDNPGPSQNGHFAIKLCRGGARLPRTVMLRTNGVVSTVVGKVSKALWVNGIDEIRYPVTLAKGANKFEIYTPEEMDQIDSVQKACCLLVGEPVVIVKK